MICLWLSGRVGGALRSSHVSAKAPACSFCFFLFWCRAARLLPVIQRYLGGVILFRSVSFFGGMALVCFWLILADFGCFWPVLVGFDGFCPAARAGFAIFVRF